MPTASVMNNLLHSWEVSGVKEWIVTSTLISKSGFKMFGLVAFAAGPAPLPASWKRKTCFEMSIHCSLYVWTWGGAFWTVLVSILVAWDRNIKSSSFGNCFFQRIWIVYRFRFNNNKNIKFLTSSWLTTYSSQMEQNLPHLASGYKYTMKGTVSYTHLTLPTKRIV